ncbi:HET-domain-containing protein [Decorospora gaudefroyi]|uniref:HET-domain-containing protein n=1 Tax=Decorospora gaudefroyi TaxID=184978 RepID=A0A6A5JV58_9PLEO|nr:HET-domain-containing protein [Decorospora gaudefroyi]
MHEAKRDGLDYFWMDTCCIDKANNRELSEAINSMIHSYHNAGKCYVFLSDVENNCLEGNGELSPRWKTAFRKSRWFNRGWTLQGLLAHHLVKFFFKEGARLGDKRSLKHTIHVVTGIPLSGSNLHIRCPPTTDLWQRQREVIEATEANDSVGFDGRYVSLTRWRSAVIERCCTYDRILTAISEEDSEYAMRILQWLTFSARLLSVEEIAEVVAIDVARDPAFDPNKVLGDR